MLVKARVDTWKMFKLSTTFKLNQRLKFTGFLALPMQPYNSLN